MIIKPPPQDWEQRPHSPQSLTTQSTEGKLGFLKIILRRPTNLGRKHPCCTYLCLSCPQGKVLRCTKPLEELSVILFLCRFHRFSCSRSTQTTSTYNQLVTLHWITKLTCSSSSLFPQVLSTNLTSVHLGRDPWSRFYSQREEGILLLGRVEPLWHLDFLSLFQFRKWPSIRTRDRTQIPHSQLRKGCQVWNLTRYIFTWAWTSGTWPGLR